MSSRVELLSRAGCHLCEDARRVVRAVCEPQSGAWEEVDVDTDDDLAQRYGELVPVVLVDGEQIGYFRIDPRRLRAAVGGTRRARPGRECAATAGPGPACAVRGPGPEGPPGRLRRSPWPGSPRPRS